MVESTEELKKLCEKKSRLYDKKGEENASRPVEEYFYDRFLRFVSTPMTKVLLHTPISGNQVTVISMVVGIIAGVFYSFPQPLYWIIGFLLIQLFHFLDSCDGQIARYRKESSLIGKYLDLLAHSVVIAAFFIGMTFGVYNVVQSNAVFLMGFISLASFLLTAQTMALRNFLVYQFAFLENRGDLVQNKSSAKVNVNSFKYFLKKLFGFDGFAFIVLFLTVMDLIFNPFYVSIGKFSILLNFRYLFLLVSAVVGPIIFIKKTYANSKIKEKMLN